MSPEAQRGEVRDRRCERHVEAPARSHPPQDLGRARPGGDDHIGTLPGHHLEQATATKRGAARPREPAQRGDLGDQQVLDIEQVVAREGVERAAAHHDPLHRAPNRREAVDDRRLDPGGLLREPGREPAGGEVVPLACEYRLLDRHGEEVWVRDDAVVMVDEDGRQLLQGLMLDISEQKRAESRLLYLADHDSLTGLFNRRRFFQELDGYLAWSERHGDPGAVLLLDMDGLKQINDSFGHEAGDELLRRTADVLRSRLRETDVLARLGGDEFVVLLRSLPARAATQMASELIALISRQRIALSDATIRPRASIGLALIEPGSGLDADSLVRLADASMYEFKSLTATGSASRAAVTSNGRRADAADELEADLDEALAAIGVELREGIRLRAEVGRPYGRVMPRFVSSLLAEAEAAALRALQRLKRAQAVSEEMRA